MVCFVVPVHRLWIGFAVAITGTAVCVASDVRGDTTNYDVTLATNREVRELTGFRPPSGNIGCYIEPGYVRCDIRDRAWSPPPRPADCPDMADYGQGIALRAGVGASFVCAGDAALNDGKSSRAGTRSPPVRSNAQARCPG
jgi:hypothetical protein